MALHRRHSCAFSTIVRYYVVNPLCRDKKQPTRTRAADLEADPGLRRHGFHGWQVQPGEPTIQGELQAALGRITGESPCLRARGAPTPASMLSARWPVSRLRRRIPAENLQRALNRTLPPAIRILEARTAPGAFHARHSAVAKTYEYRVFRGAICPPFLARYVYACSWPMDLAALEMSARLFVGEHDFLSFAATDPDLAHRGGWMPEPEAGPHTETRAFRLEPPMPRRCGPFFHRLGRSGGAGGELLVYRVRGSGFLHHMVRNLVGTMLDVGRGR